MTVTPPGPEDVRDLAQRVYFENAPLLATHVACRCFALVACTAATALNVPHVLRFDRNYREGDQLTPHYWVSFPDGSTLDMWWNREVRLRTPPRSSS